MAGPVKLKVDHHAKCLREKVWGRGEGAFFREISGGKCCMMYALLNGRLKLVVMVALMSW